MPRGRRSLQQGGVPALSQSADMSEPRRTRSASSKPAVADEIVVSENPPPPPPPPPTKRPRGRPSRASLLASHASSAASSPAPQMTTARHNGKASVISDPSVSSVSTPLDLSSDGEISTPATSKVATPVILEGSASSKSLQPMTSLEVRLPSRDSRANVENFDDTDRALRNSVYSLNPAKGKKLTEIFDSEDEDDGDLSSDVKRDVKTARRLQQEEFARADEEEELPHNMLRQRKRRTAGAEAFPSLLPTRNATKRGRASTRSSKLAPPAKKSRIIPDSEDHSQSDIDMDAEIAAAAALESKISDAPGFSEDKVSIADSDDAAEEDEDEDEPLSKRKKGKQPAQPKRTAPKGKAPAKRRLNSRSNPKAPGKAAGRGRGRGRPRAIVIEDSEDELEIIDDDEVADLISGMTWNSSVSTNVDSSAGVDSSDGVDSSTDVDSSTSSEAEEAGTDLNRIAFQRRAYRSGNKRRLKKERDRLETHHPEINTMWDDMEKMPVIKAGMAAQPTTISRQLKPFQLQGLAWMKEMEKMEWKGGLLGDEMGLGKTIQAVSLIMSDYPAKQPSLVLVPPVALMQWQSEIKSYTDGTLKTFVFHGTNQKAKTITAKELKAYDVIMMSYNSLESMYRKQEKGFKRKNGIHKEKSVIHSINFHRAILDEAHCIKTRSTMTAKACFALQTNYRWCLSGTPLQNRIGELFSLIRFLNIRPFALYLCKQCPCSTLEWSMNEASRCTHCKHAGMQHVSVFNQELLNPIQKFGNVGPGREAFRKLRLMTDRIMLRRLKKDHTNAMELPVKEVHVDRQFFGEEENDFANSIMTNGQRKFDTYVAQGVLLNNYANIFGLIMQMRQVADHPDLLLKKNAEGGQNILVCCICDEPAEDTIRSRCKHDFCRACVSGYVRSTDTPDCPTCHIALSIDLEQPEIEQDENLVKKSSIINRIKMDDWVSSSKIELLVHDLHKLRSDNASHKSIIFSQFTTMLQLIEWRLRRAGITTVMLDGSMTPAQRQASIEHFMNNVDVECFLVSLKAGGVALNLTEASRVFVVDPWWNPAAEWQSADRCHRIGQTRPCTITRLCIEDSVESRMVLIQEKKANMIHSTINADDKAMESLSPEDMQFLFRGT